jgi:hypothetical protein
MRSVEEVAQEEIERLAIDLAIARAYWRQYRKLVEANINDIPEPMRSALEEDYELDDPAPDDPSSVNFSKELKAWARRRAIDLIHGLPSIDPDFANRQSRDQEFFRFLQGIGIVDPISEQRTSL